MEKGGKRQEEKGGRGKGGESRREEGAGMLPEREAFAGCFTC